MKQYTKHPERTLTPTTKRKPDITSAYDLSRLQGIPNSLLLDMLGERNEPPGTYLGEAMRQRYENALHYQRNQIPAAEKEADEIASSVYDAKTPDEVKDMLGNAIGADFSEVRFHTDASAAQKAGSIGARAYTTKRDIYFGEGGFDPVTAAHELVHTAQQGGVEGGANTVSVPMAGVQMKPKRSSKKKDERDRKRKDKKRDKLIKTARAERHGYWEPEEFDSAVETVSAPASGVQMQPNFTIPMVPAGEEDPRVRINKMIDIFNKGLPATRNGVIDTGLLNEIFTAIQLVSEGRIKHGNEISRTLTEEESKKLGDGSGDSQKIFVKDSDEQPKRELDMLFKDSQDKQTIVEAKATRTADTHQVSQNAQLASTIGGSVLYALPSTKQNSGSQEKTIRARHGSNAPINFLYVDGASSFISNFQKGLCTGLPHINTTEEKDINTIVGFPYKKRTEADVIKYLMDREFGEDHGQY